MTASGWGETAPPYLTTSINGPLHLPYTTAFYMLSGYTFAEACFRSFETGNFITMCLGDPLLNPLDRSKPVIHDSSTPTFVANSPSILHSSTGGYVVEIRIDQTNGPEVVKATVSWGVTNNLESTIKYNSKGYGSWHRIPMDYLPPASTIYWSVTIADQFGHSVSTPVQTFVTASSTPYSGTARSIIDYPILLTQFDNGGASIAFHDIDSKSTVSVTFPEMDFPFPARSGTAVDFGWNGADYSLTQLFPGEWVAYTVNVPIAGDYQCNISTSNIYEISGNRAGFINLCLDYPSNNLTVRQATWSDPTWYVMKPSIAFNVTLPEGNHRLILKCESTLPDHYLYRGGCGTFYSMTFQPLFTLPSPSASPSSSPSRTPSPSVSPTMSPTASRSPSATPSVTPSQSKTPSTTPTPSPTPSVTPSISSTPSVTPSQSKSPSVTPSISSTPSVTPSQSKSPSSSASISPIPSPKMQGQYLEITFAATSNFDNSAFECNTLSVLDMPCVQKKSSYVDGDTALFFVYQTSQDQIICKVDIEGPNAASQLNDLLQQATDSPELFEDGTGSTIQSVKVVENTQSNNEKKNDGGDNNAGVIAAAVIVPIGIALLVVVIVVVVLVKRKKHRGQDTIEMK